MDEKPKLTKKDDEERRFYILVTGCAVVALGLTVITLSVYFINFHGSFGNQDRFGQFGDFVGGILNPAVAYCALMALLFGIRQQRKELRETRNQFGEQSIDGVFFQMLKLHNDMVMSIDSNIKVHVGLEDSGSGGRALGKGREIFPVIFKSLETNYWEYRRAPINQELLDRVYGSIFDRCQSHLGHYFRYLYNIFQFIDSANIKNEKKLFYGKLVRAQLSNHELAVLYYNCLSHLGNQKFKPLVEQYRLFKNLPIDLLLRADHYALYEPQAWGSKYEQVKAYCDETSDE